MKVLSIKQPWGSIVCSGLKHVENRSWGLKTLPLRILIHVGATLNSRGETASFSGFLRNFAGDMKHDFELSKVIFSETYWYNEKNEYTGDI